MSFLIEQAGGANHQRRSASSTSCPPSCTSASAWCWASKNEVDRVTAYHREAA